MVSDRKIEEKEAIQRQFGLVLRQHRHAVGLSQEKLALECGLDRTYISLLERGLRTPSLWIIFLLAQELGVPSTRLVGEVETRMTSEQTTD